MTGRHPEGKFEAGTFASPAWRLEMKARKSAIKDHWRCEYSFKPIVQDEWDSLFASCGRRENPLKLPMHEKEKPIERELGNVHPPIPGKSNKRSIR